MRSTRPVSSRTHTDPNPIASRTGIPPTGRRATSPPRALDRPAVPFDDRLHPLEVAREQSAEYLGIRALAQPRRTGDVAEQDRDDLANLAQWRTRL